MAGKSWKRLEWMEMVENVWKWLDMTGKYWKWLKMAGNARQWLEVAGIARISGNRWKWQKNC